MARIIDLEFNDKKYSIEYNRESIVKLMSVSKNDDLMENAVSLIECGLYKHHKEDMPDRDSIIGWLLVLGDDLKDFVEALQESVEEVLKVIQNDQNSKNVKWGVRK